MRYGNLKGVIEDLTEIRENSNDLTDLKILWDYY